MGAVKKTLATIAATSMLLAGGVATAAPASAADIDSGIWSVAGEAQPPTTLQTWLDWSYMTSTTNRHSPRSINSGGATIEVRSGTYNGVQYGWGRVINALALSYIRFEVDTNGDRRPDLQDWENAQNGSTKWTDGYPTSSSSNRAFRACATWGYDVTCNLAGPSNTTDWW
ncbi:hypothetical protein Q8791_18330 [Nocardiopsis sp. CT-R113]|uniref:Secreted protein n=1 Tax=Nocardiopsis codii TaxID=3065942 RepID=A0ABU7KAA9_9ACTN|nr:hypothetical protein [Nocardiopsis sp. CT-R113]MEE2039175.1 hypothetical protein [Nocardiopsis sp. CT-R113]